VCLAQLYAGTDIDFTGFGAAGYLFIDRNPLTDANQPTYYTGKLQAEIEFNDEIEAQLDLRGNSVTNNIVFREFSAKFKYFTYLRFKMGNIKRDFGYEYVENRENLLTINRSVVQNNLSLRGFSIRAVSIMAYYNYNKKRPDHPYSYSIALSKDNSLGTGVGLRGLYHVADYRFGMSYLFQSRGGNYPISVHGVNLEGNYSNKKSSLHIGLSIIQDPLRGQEILALNSDFEETRPPSVSGDENVASLGTVISGGMGFDTDARIIKTLEPLFLLSMFIPDSRKMNVHTLQGVLGLNLYFTKKVRFRLNADLRLTKSAFDDTGKYATNDSRAIAELQVRF
jgi:hypothetical protein